METNVYQLQCIKLAMENIDVPLILNSGNSDSKRKQKLYANILGTAEHETIKAKKQACYANILGTPKHEPIKENMQERYTNIKAHKRKLYYYYY